MTCLREQSKAIPVFLRLSFEPVSERERPEMKEEEYFIMISAKNEDKKAACCFDNTTLDP